jgi:GT2 family glycosyltransferase
MFADLRPTPRVAAVIVTYNSADVLAGCLASLHDQGVVLSDVVVVDNDSRDDTLKVAADDHDLPLRTVELGRNAGFAAGINAGVAAIDLSTVDAVMVLNPDCRLTSGSVGVLARALAQPGRGIAAPRLRNVDGTLQPSVRRRPTVRRVLAEALLGGFAGRVDGLGEFVTDPRAHSHAGPVAWATGAALLISTATIRRIGAWDESFLLYCEETEYCLRAADHGLVTWFEPAAVVTHIGGEQRRSPLLTKLAVANRVTLFRRRHTAAHSALFFAAVAVGEGLRALAGRQTSRAAFGALMRPSLRVRELPQ